MYGSPATSKDLNLFKHGKEELDLHHHPNHHYQQQQMSSGLLRYRSAPSSLFGEVCEDIHPHRSSDPEAETMLAKFMSPDLRGQIGEKHSGVGVAAGQRSPQFIQAMGPESPEVLHQQNGGFSSSVTQMLYHSQQQQLPNHSSAAVATVESSYEPYRVGSSMAMEQEQIKSAGNCSNLTRHSSSPAGFFSHLNAENGYAVMRGMGGFNPGAGSNGEAALGPSRLKNQISFSSRQGSGLMSQLSGIGSESLEDSSPEDSSGLGSANGSGRSYIPSFPVGGSWDYSPLLSDNFSSLKRSKDVDGKLVTGLNPSDAQNGEARNHVPGLTHQFSLPKNSSEMAAMEKFLQFQDSVPCKIRAKRGCATHPRSIAERVRRTRISERMRKLQELVPNMDKQTNTADMLDLAVEHIKDLQKHVENLMESRASCTCSSSKIKPYPSPAV